MIIESESLSKILGHHSNTGEIRYQGNCHKCGGHTKVEITKTSAGYGLQGVVLFEEPSQKILILCSECIKKNGNQIYENLHSGSQEAG